MYVHMYTHTYISDRTYCKFHLTLRAMNEQKLPRCVEGLVHYLAFQIRGIIDSI